MPSLVGTAAANTPVLWVVVATGAAAGLLSSIVGYALLGLPLVKVQARHELHIDANGARVESYVTVANVRGRPVKVEQVLVILRRKHMMERPRGWEFGQELAEGQAVVFTFDRDQLPNALPVMMDSAGRVWPRRRWFRVRGRALRAGGMVGFPWQRNGPTRRQIERALRRHGLTRQTAKARTDDDAAD